MNDLFPPDPPKGALPLSEAMREFMPHMVWQIRDRAEKELRDIPGVLAKLRKLPADHPDKKESYSLVARLTYAERDLERFDEEIRTALERKLKLGELVGIAQDPPPFGAWRAIPQSSWRGLRIADTAKGKVKGAGYVLADVHIMRTEVAASHEMPTGAPGRPTKGMHLIKWEFGRRVATGEIEASLAEQGRVLHVWYRDEYPLAAPPAPRSIVNKIRAAYNAAKESPGGDCTKK